MTDENTQHDHEEVSRRYELGYHLIPLVSEEELSAKVAEIVGSIEAVGGTVSTQEAPQKMTLAYEMQKDIERVRHTFNQAYFGWIKFDASPEAVVALKEKIELLDSILRFIIIKVPTVTLSTPRRASVLQKETPETPADTPAAVLSDEQVQKEMDKEIEKLVV